MKVFSVVGNRPQFIKAAPTSVALRERGIDEVVLHTGQHYDPELSQVFFEELGLEEPRYSARSAHAPTPRRCALAIAAPLGEERPDWVLVYGDTNSTLAGALAAVDAGVPLAHVEAGLRSGDLSMPEERNRIETDRLAQLLFTPDERSRDATRRRRRSGSSRSRRRRDGRRVVSPHAGRPRALARARGAGARPGRLPLAHDSPRGEHGARAPRADRRGHRRLEEPVVFPVHPRTRAALDLRRARARPARPRSSRRSATST